MAAFLKIACLAAVICGVVARPTVHPTAWRNSNLGPREARKKGLCGNCGGTGRFQQPIGGKLVAVICTDCEGSGKHRR